MLKKYLRGLANCRSANNSTSLISLYITPGTQLGQTTTFLVKEYGKASQVKSRITRQGVEDAISSIQAKLKKYNKIPASGLCIFSGNVISDGGEKRICLDYVPHRPVNKSLYNCGSTFCL